MTDSKQSGSYYTPQLLADFMVYHIFDNYQFKKSIEVLEPSAGDGIFFEALFNNPTFKDKNQFSIFNYVKNVSLEMVEQSTEAIENCKERIRQHAKGVEKIEFSNHDYLEHWKSKVGKFDLIIGNPPYIKSHHLSKKQIELCEEIHRGAGLLDKRIKNIWTSFLVTAVQSLNEEGVLCFVLPAELLQVIYAKELRNLLREKFRKIEIFAFNELVFPHIEQDVIILLCSKKKQADEGVSFYQVSELEDLKQPSYLKQNSNIHRKSLDKWTNYVLSDEELKFLDKFRDQLQPIKYYCRAEAGIVTAANEYFIVNEAILKKFSLQKFGKKILQKSSVMSSVLKFKSDDFDLIVKNEKPAYLLHFSEQAEISFGKRVQNYLAKGKELGIHKRYKSLLRDHWQCVPSIWKSEGFFTKRSNLLPKIIINEAEVFVTDSFYRIRMKDNQNIRDLSFSFCNTLTLIFSELEGRYYGGMVLELTPNEFKNLRLPYFTNVPNKFIENLDTLMREKKSLRQILDYTDEILLKKMLGVSDKELRKLRRIYEILLKRRFKKKKLNFEL